MCPPIMIWENNWLGLFVCRDVVFRFCRDVWSVIKTRRTAPHGRPSFRPYGLRRREFARLNITRVYRGCCTERVIDSHGIGTDIGDGGNISSRVLNGR